MRNILNKIIQISNHKRAWVTLLAIGIISQTVYLLKYGILIGVDSGLYINLGKALYTEKITFDMHDIWYFSYLAFCGTILHVFNSNLAIVVVQCIISIIASIALFYIGKNLFKSALSGLLSAIYFIAWPEISLWNCYIYTESLYTSLCIISFYFVGKNINDLKYKLATSILLVFTVFIRPNGIALVVAFLVYIVLYFYERIKINWRYFTFFSIIILGFTYLLANAMLSEFILIESYQNAEIIYPNITFDFIKTPDLYIPSIDLKPIDRVVIFIFKNPIYFIEITAIKLFLYVSHIKYYYSIYNNVFIIITLYPLYILAFLWFKYSEVKTPIKGFLFTFLLVNALSVCLTTENWDGRFLIPSLPFVFVTGFSYLSKMIAKEDK